MNTKLLKNLQEKHYRQSSGLFMVQGEKAVLELLKSDFVVDHIYCTLEFSKQHRRLLGDIRQVMVQPNELNDVGTFQANNSVIAVVKQRKDSFDMGIFLDAVKAGETTGSARRNTQPLAKRIVLVLDNVTDPGNLGTIIRIADWFGVTDIVASTNTTDVYNPKAIAASMGSFTRIAVHYTDLNRFFTQAQARELPIIGCSLAGEDVHTATIPEACLLVMGSEANGISFEFQRYFTNQVSIPRFGAAESLNVAIATGIVLDVFRR